MGKIARKEFGSELEELLERHGVHHFMLVYAKETLTVGDAGAGNMGKMEMRRNALISKRCDFNWVNNSVRFVLDIMTKKIEKRPAKMGGLYLPPTMEQ